MVAGFLNAPMCLLQPNEILSEATERSGILCALVATKL